MRVPLGLLAVLAMLVAAAGSSASRPSRTEVIRWSPFDSAGSVKKTLEVKSVRGGRCTDIGYTYVGGVAYRCGAGRYLYNACWRRGPNPTEFVICAAVPWDRTVARLRSRHLLLYPGVTYEKPATYPWAVELADGNRCRVHQGAHDVVRTHGKVFVVDYGCEHDNLVLLREDLRRGRLWYAKAARWSNATGRYRLLGDVPLRRVYFGTLPPPMHRQHSLAREAVAAAKRVVRRPARERRFELVWVRLALPRANWARVLGETVGGGPAWSVVLRRADGHWSDASAYRPYCTRLPTRVRRQLFFDADAKRLPWYFLAPRGEKRC